MCAKPMTRAEHTDVVSGEWHLSSFTVDGLPIVRSDQGEPDVDSHKRTYVFISID